METIANIHIHKLMVSVFDVAQSRTIFRLAPVLADNSLHAPVVPSHHLRRNTPSLKGRRWMSSRLRHQLLRTRRKENQSEKTKPSGKSGDVDLDETVQDEQEEPDEPANEQEDEAEVSLADAQTSESEMESDGMLDWSASECKDYKEGAFATVACASPPVSQETSGGVLVVL